LADTIEKILSDDKMRAEIGENARKEIVENWDWKKKIKEVEGFYHEIVSHN